MLRGLVCLVLSILFFSSTPTFVQAQNLDEQISIHLDSLFAGISNTSSGDAWWLISTDGIGEGDFEAVVKDTREQEAVILDALNCYRPSGATADSVYTFLTPLRISFYLRGASLSVNIQELMVGREFCLVSLESADDFPAILYFSSEEYGWSAFMVPGINWPPALLAAHLYTQGYYGWLAENGSYENDPEGSELTALSIEAEVLSLATQGQTFELADEIIRRSGTRSYEDALLSLTLDDCQRFAQLVRAGQAGPIVSAAAFDGLLATIAVRSSDHLLGNNRF